MNFPVSACPQALPVEAGISSYTTDFFFVDFHCRRFDGVYPAIDISTPLNVTAGGAQRDSSFFVIFYLGCKTRFAGACRVMSA